MTQSRDLLALALLRKPASLNKTEGRYFDRLVLERANGDLLEFLPHAVTLILGPDCRYTPDFLVVRPPASGLELSIAALEGRAGVLELHEVKGPHIRTGDDGMVKLRTAAARFPWLRFILAHEQRGGAWRTEEICP